MKQLVIIGVGGFAREVYSYAHSSLGYGDAWRIKGFLDGDRKLAESAYSLLRAPLLGNVGTYQIAPDDVFVCAIADPQVKARIVSFMQSRNADFISLVHNTAIVDSSAQIGYSVILCPFTLVSSQVTIGNFVTVNYYSSIGHDVVVGDYVSIMGHVDIMGNVEIRPYAYFGSGSRVLPNGKIGERAIVGAGSVVLKKVENGQVVAGVPSRPIKDT